MLLIGIFGTIVYIFVSSAALMKIGSADSCGWDQITNVGNKGVNNYTFVLDGSHAVGVMPGTWSANDYNTYGLRVRGHAADYSELAVYNLDNSSRRTFFMSPGSNDVRVSDVNFKSGEYIFIECVNCNVGSPVTLFQETLGSDQEIVYYNHSVQNYEVAPNLYVYLYADSTCYSLVKSFFWLWVGLLFFILLIIGLNKGYEETGDTILKWD